MSDDAKRPAEKLSFEDALARLETIVGELEEGELALEKSLALFEEGVSLARRLEERLAAAETRVEELLRHDEERESIAPLDVDPEEEDA